MEHKTDVPLQWLLHHIPRAALENLYNLAIELYSTHKNWTSKVGIDGELSPQSKKP